MGAFHSTQNFGWGVKWNGPFRFGPTGIFGTSLVKVVHFDRSSHFGRSDRNVPFHLTVPLFCILLTRTITKRAVAWVAVQSECTVPLRTKFLFLCWKNISLVCCAHSWNIFQHSKRNFVSPCGHVISSIYLTLFWKKYSEKHVISQNAVWHYSWKSHI